MAAKRSKSVASELGRAVLGDPRRSKRLARITQAFIERPGASLPKATGDDAGLEAAYRLLSNESVTSQAVLQPHVEATVERVVAARRVFAISDTTELRFGGDEREGLGPLQGDGHGFLAHVCLAVADDGSRLPLGVLSLETIVRPQAAKGRRGTNASRQAPDRESLKWLSGADVAERAVQGRAELVHVMDREADIYELLAKLMAQGRRFVVRVAQDRALASDEGLLFEALEQQVATLAREVALSRRKKGTKRHPARAGRRAQLSVAAATLELKRPRDADKKLPATLRLNFVRVYEESPPPGEEPVDWKLVTSEPIDTKSEMEAVVDAYRARWVVEELFKALKTGCAIEKSQLESLGALLNLLAIKLPVAVQLLALRSQAESNQKALALGILTPLQLEVLRAMGPVKLTKNPTASEALLAVAALGGHIKNNGHPGWQVLGRGFEDLVRYEAAWAVFKANAEM